jgi:hypothetical protein
MRKVGKVANFRYWSWTVGMNVDFLFYNKATILKETYFCFYLLQYSLIYKQCSNEYNEHDESVRIQYISLVLIYRVRTIN